MAYDINEILALPVRERRKISEKLLNSLPENKEEVTLSKIEKQLLDERWQSHVSGKSKSFTSKEMWGKLSKLKPKK
jgi:putative addiction module component (TIGR02574 family)